MGMSRTAIEYLKSMADEYEIEISEIENNDMIIAILEKQEAAIMSLIERNTRLKEELNCLNRDIINMVPNAINIVRRS